GRLGGDVDDHGIDLEEAPALVRFRVAGKGTGAEADDAEAPLLALRGEALLHNLNGARERARWIVVGRRRRIGGELAIVVADALRAVQRRAVRQDVIVGILRQQDAVDAEIAALRRPAPYA